MFFWKCFSATDHGTGGHHDGAELMRRRALKELRANVKGTLKGAARFASPLPDRAAADREHA